MRYSVLLVAVAAAAATATATAAAEAAAVPAAAGSAASSLCCPEGELGEGRLCADGGPFRLDNCTHAYFLEVTRDSESLEVDDHGHLLFNSSGTIADEFPGQFCVSELWPNGSVAGAVVCFPEWLEEESSRTPVVQYQVYGALLLVSVVFLLVTLAIYLALPPLRDRDGLCLSAYMGSLAVGSGSLALLQFFSTGIALKECVAMAFFTYYWLLSAFFWLNIVAFNVWQCVTSRRVALRPRTMAACLLLYGWGSPLVFLVAALATHHAPRHLQLLAPGFGELRCWFTTQRQSWAYFFGPVAVLLAANLVMFLWAAVLLWRTKPTSPCSRPHKTLRYRCRLYTKLSLIMGVTWLMEVISFATGDNSSIWFVGDVVNCLQGVLIFLLLVVVRRRVRRLLLASCPLAARRFGVQARPLSQAESLSEDEDCEGVDADTEDAAHELKGAEAEAQANGHSQ